MKRSGADTRLRHRFDPRDGHALDGIIGSPVAEDLAFVGASVLDGRSGILQPNRCVVIRNGKCASRSCRESGRQGT